MINIVFVGRNSFPNGSAMSKRHRYMMDYLSSQEDVVVTKYCSWNSAEWKNEACGVYSRNVEYINTQYKKSLLSLLLISKEGCKILKNRYKKGSKNVLIFNSSLSFEQMPMLLYAKRLGYKVVFDVVENYDSLGGDVSMLLKVSHKISRSLYKHADGFFVISTSLQKLFSKRIGSPICLMPNSTPQKEISNKEKFGSPFKVLYAGTFASKDGVRFLIAGFDNFCKKTKINAELILIGKGHIDEQSQKIMSNNLAIKRLGFVSDEELEMQLQGADVLAMTRCNSPFANYGFPFKLSEYLATGNIVIATQVGDVSAYLKNRKNSFIVQPEDADEIADALMYIIMHEKESIDIGKQGQTVVEECFSIKKNGVKMLNFIKSL